MDAHGNKKKTEKRASHKHAYLNILKSLPPNNETFQIKKIKNIDYGYSLEPPRRGGSNEYPQSIFLRRNKKNIPPVKPSFTI